MKLEKELGLTRGIKVPAHEALLNIYFTGDLLKKRARQFFSAYNITDVQFNLLELLYYQADLEVGLTQQKLSRMFRVNQSNITSLIDRMEKAGLVERTDVPGDRRYYAIKLTAEGKRILEELHSTYINEVKKIMSVLTDDEMGALITSLERIREGLRR
jgi:DNA-binding MarR family transcriptional regulator